MIRRLMIGVAVVFGVAVTVSNPLMSVILAVGAWIYVARMVSKNEDTVVSHHMKTRIKTLLIVAAVSFVLFLVGAIVHNVLSDLSETEETVFLLVTIFASWIVVVSTAGGLALIIKERGKTNLEAAVEQTGR